MVIWPSAFFLGENKVALRRVMITGCSSGLGAELVRQYLQLGWEVFAAVTSLERAGEMALLAGESHLSLVAMDVCKAGDIELARDQIQSSGCLDLLILSAGVHEFSPVETMDFRSAERLMEVNFFGILRCVQSFVPMLRKQGFGRVLAVSSLSAQIGLPCDGVYAASKAALEKLLESLRAELSHFGVSVCVVAPSGFSSGLLSSSGLPGIDGASPYFPLVSAMMERQSAPSEGSLQKVAGEIVSLSVADAVGFREPVGAGADDVLRKIYRMSESQRAAAVADWSGTECW